MPRNVDVALVAGWNQLTANSAVAVGVQNKNGFAMTLQATTNTTAPTDRSGYELPPMAEGLYTLSQSFPGLTAPIHLWAWVPMPGLAFVSHD